VVKSNVRVLWSIKVLRECCDQDELRKSAVVKINNVSVLWSG
jgi:hypothetical protein